MNGREACKWQFSSLLFSLLSNIILLQAILLAQSDIRDEGDWLIWASRVEPKTLNPISAENDVYCRWITRGNTFEPLLVYDFDTLELKPRLAESYEVLPAVHSGQAGSSDGMEITFRLRNDVHFSDGAPVTADDVIFTYQTIINPMIDAANIASLYIDVVEAIRVNERTVKFIMKRPYFKALEILSFWDVGILPEHIYKFSDAAQFNKHISNPTGSGPYVFEKWDTGREIVLRRNENYWGDKPKLKKIIYKFITNPLACIQALRSHQVDIIIPESEQFADLADDQKFCEEFYSLAYWNPGVPFFYIGWNQNTPFFSDKRVRLAMTYMINREEIVQHLLSAGRLTAEGNGQVITGPFYIKGNQNDTTIEPWPYCLAKAVDLLEQAGWIDSDGDGLRDKDGTAFRFRFMFSSDSALYNRLARFLKDEMTKAGIEVVLDPLEWSVILSRLTNRQFEAYIAGWSADLLEDPYKLFHSSQTCNGGCNYVGFSNPQADAIIEQAKRTINDDERNRLYHQLHRILHEEQPFTFLFTRPSFRLVDRRFKNVTIHKMGLNDLEWYVPEKAQRYK
jgi:peptide/nickel transport system substrate-binding protein